MAKRDGAIVGVSDHGGWAVFVTVQSDGKLVDRRRVELVEKGLPALPHHCQAQSLPVAEGVALVERVRSSAETCAKERLASLAESVSIRIVGIALRECQPLPATVAERISNYRAQNVADWVMYRQALALAAEARRWTVHWYDARYVLGEASRALGKRDIHALLEETRKALGPPWQKDHRLAMAAAIASRVSI